MAEEKKKMSPETEAIIDRLKREGQLTRNSEGNSIKSIKMNLEKFTEAFSAIQTNTAETAKILSDSFVDSSTEVIKKVDETLTDMTDEQKAAELQRRKDVKAKAVADKENAREKGSAEIGLKNILSKGLGKISDGFAAVKKDPWGSLLNIGKWAVIIPILVGAIKGVLDLVFGENRMTEIYTKIADSNFIKALSSNSWATITAGLLTFVGIKWLAMKSALMLAAKVMSMGSAAAARVGGVTPVPGAPVPDGKDGKPGKKPKSKFKLGRSGKIGLIVAGGVGLYSLLAGGEDEEEIALEDELAQINKDAGAKELEVKENILDNFEKERVTVTDALVEATVAGGFGAFGGFVGAGVAVTGSLALSGITRLGQGVNDYFNDIDELSNETESLIRDEQKKLEDITDPAERAAKLAETNTALQAERDRIAEEAGAVDTTLAELQALKEGGKNSIGFYKRGNMSINERRLDRMIKDAEEQRVLFQKQMSNTDIILQSRQPADVAVADVPVATTENVEILPSTVERDIKQAIADKGGAPVNITNHYYNKGGDTVLTQQSDNRIASNSNKSVLYNGAGGGGNIGSGSLPTGAHA
tara:strand:+ start:3301 stop:5058 length:1758 start_codon:yes stop_codon:yes gene_type:complete